MDWGLLGALMVLGMAVVAGILKLGGALEH